MVNKQKLTSEFNSLDRDIMKSPELDGSLVLKPIGPQNINWDRGYIHASYLLNYKGASGRLDIHASAPLDQLVDIEIAITDPRGVRRPKRSHILRVDYSELIHKLKSGMVNAISDYYR